ncbi:MAG TPA: oligosaccharide flippase family protein [Verrucomicrobiae bacterium]|nr:oligosaccharide flippase family protein [Verrucomicrobiae bacterium]
MFSQLTPRLMRHKSTLVYTGSNVTLAAANFLGSFICARLLAPSDLGAVQTAMLLLSYVGFLHFGVFNGFNRHYPFLLGQGDLKAAGLLVQVGYTVARLTALVAAIIAAGQFLFAWKRSDDSALVLATAAVIPIVALTLINTLQMAILAGRQDFGWIARTQFLTAFATVALLPLVWKFSVGGQCARLVAVAAISWALFRLKIGDGCAWRWDTSAVSELFKIGFPILAIGYVYSIFSVADRTLLAWVRGTEAVGQYALAGLTVAAIQSIALPLGAATYSKANQAYGRSQALASLTGPLKRFLILLTISVLPLAVLIYFCLPVAVPWLLPQYTAGIRAGQIACIASVAFCYSGTAFVYNVTRHNLVYGVIVGAGLTSFFLIGFLIPKSALTLERVAWLRAIISVFICLVSNAYLFWYFRRNREPQSLG